MSRSLDLSASAKSAMTYFVHGLRVRSDLKLDAPLIDSPGHDLLITLGRRRAVPDAAPDGTLLARLDLPGGSSSLADQGNRYILRIHRQCDFELAEDLDRVTVHESPQADREFAGLMAGSMLACVLALRGFSVLHASAVEVGGEAVAFVASSGMGKTTAAAACCAAGARLVTDDVLRVEVAGGRGWCFRGSQELRLRAPAAVLADALSAATRRSTLDERYAVGPAASGFARLPIWAVVTPRFDPDADRLAIDRIRGARAVRTLVSFPRTVGWTNDETAKNDFGVLATLAQLVPIYEATLPRALDARLGQEILSAVGQPVAAAPRL